MYKSFIILDTDPIVRMDLEGTLAQKFPSCRVTAGASLSDVGGEIKTIGPDTLFFVRNTLLDDDLIRVLRAAVTRGSRVITIGPVDNLGLPSTTIEMPFTSEMIIDLMDRPLDDAPAA